MNEAVASQKCFLLKTLTAPLPLPKESTESGLTFKKRETCLSLPWAEEHEFVRARDESHEDLDGEPRVTNALDEEEGVVGVGLVLVQGPGGRVAGRPHGDVPYHGHPHIWMRLQAEGHDRDDDEEHRNNSDHLEKIEESRHHCSLLAQIRFYCGSFRFVLQIAICSAL